MDRSIFVWGNGKNPPFPFWFLSPPPYAFWELEAWHFAAVRVFPFALAGDAPCKREGKTPSQCSFQLEEHLLEGG